MKETLISYGIPATKIRVLRCGVDPDHFTLRSRIPKNPMFFSVGRFTEKKAPYLTVLAFAEARQVLPEARLVLAGDGELLEATANLAIALDISKSVEFVGVQTPAQVADWMGQATALVQHSITPRFGPKAGDKEGTPVAVMEAMMSGLPVIGTNHAGIGEIVEHRKTGLLVEERDIHAMAKAMIEIHSDPVVAARLGATAREKAVQIYSKGFYIAALESLCIAESSAEH
jgi:glycosyltransferase involved in cell wall biosynthesis